MTTTAPELQLTLEAGTRIDLFRHGSAQAHGIPDISAVLGYISNRGWGDVELTVDDLFTGDHSPIGMFVRVVNAAGARRTVPLKVTALG
ncbi:hypothetical protein [Leifsonia poae]|uniref:Uncharacterized protein n=1 Tax=Leifsonia poae TaxID=110933 RepID=A0A9W6HBX4_9MICO|nr:hypothetical protein [Leifsonia poae]GLJ77675.1 hypothetical protein GCM10017584_32490 [Leifsonia poae]